MQPIYMCDSCKKPIIGTVFSRDDLEMCLDCYWDRASDPYNPSKNESKPEPQAYKSFAPEVAPDEMVVKPPHYNQAGIECIDAMKAMTEGAEVSPHEAYCWQNAFKYLWRWPYKHGVQDLRKAQWYLDRLIKEMEGA